MTTLLLVIIYLAFISLGLPDSLLGVAWPLMRKEYGLPIEAAGLVSMVIAGSTIISSLASGAVLKRISTGKVTLISCLMTAGSLLGFAFSPSLVWLLFLAVPLGLGAGSIDTALNNYVATHYKAHHMSWLHSFWGVGATLGPIILSSFILAQNSWRKGYITVSIIQFTLAVLFLSALPLWDRTAKMHTKPSKVKEEDDEVTPRGAQTNVNMLKIKGVKSTLLTCLFYCGVEATIGLWGSSFLVNVKELPAAVAAQWVSTYYAGITIGRFVTGFITLKVNNRDLIRAGQITVVAGTMLLLLPLPSAFSLAGFILVGLGCAPIFPCMLHETPIRFGKENSQTIIGYQMAVAYSGTTFLPPFFGWLASRTTIWLLPVFLLACAFVMLAGSENINNMLKRRGAVSS